MDQLISADTNEIFAEYPAFLPALTDGETLFSWAARYHRLSGNALAMQSSRQLFGDQRAGLRSDFPSHLNQLVTRSHGLIGDADTLAYERTLFGFFAPFQSEQNKNYILNQMRSTSIEKVKSALGLLPSRLGAFFPLKFCHDCVRDDLKRYAISRWHLEHQWPSVWICRKHHRILHALKRECQPRDLRLWLLPEDLKAADWTGLVIRSSAMREKLLWLAEFSAHLVHRRGQCFDQQLLRYTYLLRAKNLGWLFTDGSFRLAQVRALFLKYYSGLDKLPGFEAIQSVHTRYGGMLGLLLRQYDWRRHPVKHLLLMAFLFESITEFDATYGRVRDAYGQGGINAMEGLITGEWKLELKRLVEAGRSLSEAALAIGVPLSVAVRAAKHVGVEYQKRPRVLNTKLGDEVMAMVARGLSRDEILRIAGIKKTLLKTLMARRPALRDAWRKKDFERRRGGYRSNFLALTDRYKGVPVKKLRLISGNGVSWLYRNDRDWLIANLPAL